MGKNRGKTGRAQHRSRKGRKRVYRAMPVFEPGEVECRRGEIAEAVGIARVPPDWDVLLVGDGSSRDRGGPCGWGTVLYDRARRTRRVFFGATSEGSCLLSELVPYVQAMLWFERYRGPALRRESKKKALKVVVVSDCQTLVRQGETLERYIDDARRLKATRPMWLVLRHVAASGYAFEWKWVRRSTLAANREMNLLSQAARASLERRRERDDEEG